MSKPGGWKKKSGCRKPGLPRLDRSGQVNVPGNPEIPALEAVEHHRIAGEVDSVLFERKA